jgi:hypothetical protein
MVVPLAEGDMAVMAHSSHATITAAKYPHSVSQLQFECNQISGTQLNIVLMKVKCHNNYKYH